MNDSRGISLVHKDIVARRTEVGWRISRVAVVGFTDSTKQHPLVMCIDFESHGAGHSWQPVTDPSRLQRLASGDEMPESTEELLKRIPNLSGVHDEFGVHEISQRFALVKA